MDFLKTKFNITQITLACFVKAGTGNRIHNNRPSHGIALNLGGEKRYKFAEKTYVVRQNDMIFLPEGSDYIVDDVIDGDCYAINFKTDSDGIFSPFVLHIKNHSKMLEYFSSAEKMFEKKTDGYDLKCKSELYAALYLVVSEMSRQYIPNGRNSLIFPAVEYIHNNYIAENIEIRFLAELCGISVAYLRRLFVSEFGVSPLNYINSLKLSRAKELLSESEYQIDSVAELSGFNDTAYFCRYFKKEIGMTAREYKNSLK